MNKKINRFFIFGILSLFSFVIILSFQNCAKKSFKTNSNNSQLNLASTSSDESSNFDSENPNSSSYPIVYGASTTTTLPVSTNEENCSISVIGKNTSNGIYDYPVGDSLKLQVNIKPELKSRIFSMFWQGTRNRSIRDAFGGSDIDLINQDKESRFVNGNTSAGSIFEFPNIKGDAAGLYERSAVFRDSSGGFVCQTKSIKARFLNKYLGSKACFVLTNKNGSNVSAKLDNAYVYNKYDFNIPSPSGLDIIFSVISIDENGNQKEELKNRTLWSWTAVGGDKSYFKHEDIIGDDPQNVSASMFSDSRLSPYINIGLYHYAPYASEVTYNEWAVVYDENGNYVCRTSPTEIRMHTSN